VSVVYRGVWAGRNVAVKLAQDTSAESAAALTEEYRAELKVMCGLEHHNIVRILGACLQPPELCIVMELSGPSLAKLLHRTTTRFDHQRRE
jgi:hypothetical protein